MDKTPEQIAAGLRIEASHVHCGYLLRDAAELIDRLTHERRNIISHGIGGYSKAVDSMNMNDACVAISAFHNRLYADGKKAGRAAILQQENTHAD